MSIQHLPYGAFKMAQTGCHIFFVFPQESLASYCLPLIVITEQFSTIEASSFI
jgi:hypothetical protein